MFMFDVDAIFAPGIWGVIEGEEDIEHQDN